ncbi:glucose 1-dehydrogenase [Natrinema pallidum]|uniref:Glucose 1-dehydrogenase n=2 Tax=Natrinema pallidum TaxID=69527 RepID=L9Z0F1_9EURY|nr:glucose 1-dehydrogenase [Natrinema pallidum]ELY79854.1 Alcohol dehydrogenase GroES domain protein [Natrinema pallidum DSM 3751]QCW02274.1 glucose dehydrogenase [Natrinema pallidum]
MKAIAVTPGAGVPEVVERPVPAPSPGEALVRICRVGVDGTDYEVIDGTHGSVPDGDDRLILGHEAVGIVADANGTALEEGQYVVPTVRRPPPGVETNAYFERGEPDMAPDGEYVERGIVGAHGFMAEFVTSPADCLVPIPADLAPMGFLVEPISITEKAIEHARATRSAFDWRPASALVLGTGSLGLLTAAMLTETLEYDRVYCLGRKDRPHPTIDIVDRLGATYIDSRETPVSEIPAAYEPMDLVYEATGHAKHAFEAIEALAPNGVAALLGVPGDWTFEVDGGHLHRELVLSNKALVGSVNSNRGHFEAAIDTLSALPDWVLTEIVSGVYDLAALERAFPEVTAPVAAAGGGSTASPDDDTTIKTAIEFEDI